MTAIGTGCWATVPRRRGRDEAADEDLAGPADVEEAGLEPDADREAGEDERAGRGHGVRHGPRGLLRVDRQVEGDRAAGHVDERQARRALEQALVGDERQQQVDRPFRRQARGDDQERADEERQEDRDDRDRGERPDPADAWPSGRRRRASARRRSAASTGGIERRPAAISSPISSRSAVGPSTSATISPRYITAMRSDSSRTSSSSAETRRIAAPSSRFAIDLAVDELDAADVEAARRLVEDERRQLPAELAGDDRLLLVAAGQGRRRHRRRRRPDVVLRDRPLGPVRDRLRRCGAGRGRRAPRRTGSGRGCRPARSSGRARSDGDRPGRTTSRDAGACRGPLPVTSRPARLTDPARRLAQAGECLDELLLAIAGDTGDAEDLAGADLEADAVDGLRGRDRRRPGGRTRRGSARPGATRRGRPRAGRSGRPSAPPGRPRRSRPGSATRRPCRVG